MWALLRDAPDGAVMESFRPQNTRPFVTAGLDRLEEARPLEIWCDVPPDTARARFVQRLPQRHPVHGSSAEWEDGWSDAAPLGVGPSLRVDTTRALELDKVVDWIHLQSR